MLGQFPQSLKEDRRWVCFDAQKHPIDIQKFNLECAFIILAGFQIK